MSDKKSPPPENSAANEVDVRCLVRPSTRGELATRLKKGESCEVAAHVAEMTSIMLKGWLDVENFAGIPSENKGWVIYQPNARVEERQEVAPTIKNI